MDKPTFNRFYPIFYKINFLVTILNQHALQKLPKTTKPVMTS